MCSSEVLQYKTVVFFFFWKLTTSLLGSEANIVWIAKTQNIPRQPSQLSFLYVTCSFPRRLSFGLWRNHPNIWESRRNDALSKQPLQLPIQDTIHDYRKFKSSQPWDLVIIKSPHHRPTFQSQAPASPLQINIDAVHSIDSIDVGIKSSNSKFADSRYTFPKTERLLNITVATTAEGWNIVANEQLTIELAKNPRVKVYGLVPRSTQEQRYQAKKSNIELVDAKEMIGFSEEDLIAYPPDDLDIDILIMHSYGHDLGKQAQDIKEKKNCKWVHVVHTISAELANYKQKVSSTDAAYPDWLSDHELQLALCEEADIIIAIGPKVADAYKGALRHCGKHKDVITMTPGIIHDLADAHTVCEGGEKFHVMISATYPSKYFKVKGCDIAAKAITLLKDLSYHLIFVVLPNDDAVVLRSQLKGLISLSQVTVKHVPRSSENWRKQLCQVDLVILPSAEGFGTSCVRAISAGVPVLSSGNSGFGMALKKLPSGKMHVLDSEDPREWADQIRKLRNKGPTQLADEAKQLREGYMRQYCWKDQCDQLVDKMMEIVQSKEGMS